MKAFYLLLVLLFSFSSFGIFNLKTAEEQEPKISSKSWVIVAQGCHSCSELLVELKTFCRGDKPSPNKLGFLISGSNKKAMLKKLADFKVDYEIFAGSPNEFYQHYNIMTSPSLKSGKKVLSGKSSILEFLKKDQAFCNS